MSTSNDTEQRIARKIARAKIRHMSNRKWRKLFTALHDLSKRCPVIEIKLIGQQVLRVPTPGPTFEHNDNFGECGGISYVPFSHIECVRISNDVIENDALINHLRKFGQWPICETHEGILILGYEWD